MSDALNRIEIEALRSTLKTYWNGAGHDATMPNRLCDMALASLRDPEPSGANANKVDGMPTEIKPVSWRREWDGDISDLGSFVHADDESELDHHGQWEALYSQIDVDTLRSRLAAALSEVERLRRIEAERLVS